MSRPLRIAMFVGCFPVVSETFILRQITGLLDLGHDVRIISNTRPESAAPVQPEVDRYDLRHRTFYVDGPPESVLWEMPVFPKRRFQHGAVPRNRLRERPPEQEAVYRRQFLSIYT